RCVLRHRRPCAIEELCHCEAIPVASEAAVGERRRVSACGVRAVALLAFLVVDRLALRGLRFRVHAIPRRLGRFLPGRHRHERQHEGRPRNNCKHTNSVFHHELQILYPWILTSNSDFLNPQILRSYIVGTAQIPPKQMYFTSRYSSIPYFEPSRPMPDSLT